MISIDEYLHTSYRPDCDYVDGEVQERLWGEYTHARALGQTLVQLVTRYPGLRSRVLPSLRVRVKATRVRVPDICVLAEDAPNEQIPSVPPILCIEILSEEDTFVRIMDKLRDFFQMGVRTYWIIDPALRSAWVATPGQLTEPADGILRAGEIEMPLAEVLEPPAGAMLTGR
jgi:Uma2 family endonuclease